MSLKSKLFLFTLFITTSSLLFFGLLYYNDINDIFDKQTKQSVKHDRKMATLFIQNVQQEIQTISDEISKHEEIKSALSLLSAYDTPDIYENVMYNHESASLLQFSNNWIHENSNYSISFYNNHGDLLSINRQIQKKKEFGSISYDDTLKRYFSDIVDTTNTTIPSFSKLNDTNINNTYRITLVNPLYINENLIGYSKVAYSFDNRALKKMKNTLLNDMVLKNNDQYLLPDSLDVKKLDHLKSSRDFIISYKKIFGDTNPLFAVSIVDKRDVYKKLNNLIADMFVMWSLILGATLVTSFTVTSRYILEPIKNLQHGIQNIKENNFEDIKILNNDEIGIITKEFNAISKELGNNISFLESYKSAMDKGNIVTKADLEGNITYVNQNFTEISGYSKEESIGKPHNIVNNPDTPKEIFKELWETIEAKKTWRGILRNVKKDGSFYWVDIVIEPILNNKGEIIEYIGIRHEITELVLQRERLNKIANTDNLTGLGNRFKLKNDIQALERSYIGILNIDKFRQTNDFYGHEFGDKLIIELTSMLKTLAKEEKDFMLYHLQGDEFVILNHTQDKTEFYDSIQSIVKDIEHTTFKIENEYITIKLTAAISYEKYDKVLQTADMALQIAKRQDVEIYIYNEKESLYSEYENNIKWTKKLKEAIDEDRIVPFFQPIVNNKNKKFEKYESLVRIIDKDEKVISPFFFLDIAKQTKHYTSLTKIMIEKSFDFFKDKDCEFSINLTIDDILNNQIQTFIFIMLETNKIGNRVVFEIVESESIENFEDVSSFISNVKEYGCKIAIDDFGTGYSNFEYLMKLKADYIKIDGSMIKDIDTNNDARMVVSTIVDFAKKMDMKTIAEFVENEAILNVVIELGIDYTQGYYYSEPKQGI